MRVAVADLIDADLIQRLQPAGVEQLGHLPRAGDWVEVGGRPAEVTEVDEASVTQLRFPADPGNSPAR